MAETFFAGFTCGACGLTTIGPAYTHTREQCLERQLTAALAVISELEAEKAKGTWQRAKDEARQEPPAVIRDDLVRDMRGISTRLCDFCGREDDPQNMDPEEADMWACAVCSARFRAEDRAGNWARRASPAQTQEESK